MLFCNSCDSKLIRQNKQWVCPNCRTSQVTKRSYDIQSVSKYQTLQGSFPKAFSPRSSQLEILSQIESALNSGFKKIIICAPTGVGKSAIATTLASYFGSSFIVTATKKLQDQYVADFGFVPVKGKSNFACFKLMQAGKIDLTEKQFAIKTGLTCNYGKCAEKEVKNGIEKEVICEFKPSLESFDKNSENEMCPYYVQKYDGLRSEHSVWNYAAFFQLLKFSKSAYGNYLKREVVIFDEAHKIEDEIISFVGMDIYRSYLEDANINSNHYDLNEKKMVLQLLEDLESDCIEKINDHKNKQETKESQKLDARAERLRTMISDFADDPKNFVIDLPEDSTTLFSIKPLNISKYTQVFFDNPVQIFMSATINRTTLCQNLGFEQADVAFVEIEKSPFLLENRKIIFENIAPLGANSSLTDERNVLKRIDDLLYQYHDKRGLVLTSSKKRCNEIKNSLSPTNRARVIIAHSDNIDEAMRMHKKTPHSVLLSSSLWEGIDLKGDLSEFQIIAKTPYPNLGEKRIQEKKIGNPLWFSSVTITKLLQGFGRSIRDYDDKAITHVLDTRAFAILKMNQNLIPKSFHDLFN